MTTNIQSIAAVDIGSNSFHVVTARIVDGKIQPLYRNKERVRLAEGLHQDGNLSKQAIERGIAVLAQFKDVLSGIDADSIRIVGTYTLREALNSDEFLDQAAEVLPYPIEIIPGVEEARLIYQGVAHTHAFTGKRIVIDIGGGSTELAAGIQFENELLRSLHMGAVSFKEKYFAKGNINEKAYNRAVTAAKQELELVEDKYKAYDCETFVGCSGTIRTLASIAGGESLRVLTKKQLHKIRQKVLSVDQVSDLNFAGISEQRCQVLPSGLAILDALFDCLDITELEISEAALREGVLYEMADRLRHLDIRQRTVESLQKRYFVDEAQSNRVAMTALELYLQVKKDWQLQNDDFQQLLKWACQLHEIGFNINTRGYHKHSSYILENGDLTGFNQEQQLLLAMLVRFCRNKIKPEYISNLHFCSRSQARRLMVLLRLAVLLNLKRLDNFLPELTISVTDSKVTLLLDKQWLEHKPLVKADLELEQQLLLDIQFELVFE